MDTPIRFSATSARIAQADQGEPKPPNVWRENGEVWIHCQGCSRRLKLTDIPAGVLICPDCHERHDYNLTDQLGHREKVIQDYLMANREACTALIELLAATEGLPAYEAAQLIRCVSKEALKRVVATKEGD